jgi:hypothetical protein
MAIMLAVVVVGWLIVRHAHRGQFGEFVFYGFGHGAHGCCLSDAASRGFCARPELNGHDWARDGRAKDCAHDERGGAQ